jgi:hypothetical protein
MGALRRTQKIKPRSSSCSRHFVPLLVALRASVDEPGPVRFPITGFMGGSFTRRSVQFG